MFFSSLLLKLHDECIASEYGTFLCNSEAERIQLKTKSKTYSIWKLFQMKQFTNPLYEGKFFSATIITVAVLLEVIPLTLIREFSGPSPSAQLGLRK